MSTPQFPDLRFDKPAKESLLDLIERQRQHRFDPTHVDILSVTPFDERPLTTQHVLERTLFSTTAELELNLPNKPVEIIQVQYFRLLLSAFLYKDVIKPLKNMTPFLFNDRFATTQSSFAEDALAYLNEEYHVALAPEDCAIISRHSTPHLNGTWDVVVTPLLTHPVWVGPVLLTAYNGVP